MNLFHMIWLLVDVIFLILSWWIKRGVMWGITLALDTFIAYMAITQGWDALYFAPIIGLFIISIMGFIHESLEGRFI